MLSLILLCSLSFLVQTSNQQQLPVVLMHGIASDKTNMNDMQNWLQDTFNLTVFNVDIGDGYDTSVNTPMMQQTQLLCQVLAHIPELAGGFNFIGMSQGGLLARSYTEMCNNPPVYNLITLVSPHGGEYDNDSLFNIIDVYGQLWQTTTSFASYWINPNRYEDYLNKCSFLPALNGEKSNIHTHQYRNNLLSLNNFVMVWSSVDDVVKPAQSGKFSVYDINLNIIDLFDTTMYQEDIIGLRTLNDTNRLWMFQTDCPHNENKSPSCYPQLYPVFKEFLINN